MKDEVHSGLEWLHESSLVLDIDGFMDAVEYAALSSREEMATVGQFYEALCDALGHVRGAGDIARRLKLVKAQDPDSPAGASLCDLLVIAKEACGVGLDMARMKYEIADELGVGTKELRPDLD